MTTATTDRPGLSTDAVAFLDGGPKKLLIGGRWVAAHSGETFETIDPTTERVIGHAASAAEADVDDAVAAARRAFDSPGWAGMNPHDRSRLMLRIAHVLDSHAEELAQLETLDNGLTLAATRGLTGRLSQVFEYYAGWVTKLYGETNPSTPGTLNFTLREPLGVCGQIIPWNGPLMMAAWKIAPAIATGNTVVLKPAEQTPLTAVRLGELLLEADLPAGVVNILTGFGRSAGAALAAHPGVDKVAFTGSTEVGKRILQASAGNLKRVTLELGGKSPNVIFDDADLDKAVAGAARGFCTNSGQMCVAGSRIFAHKAIHDEFVERLGQALTAHRVGDPFAAETTMGPLVSRTQFDRVNGYIDLGREQGGQVRHGGERHTGTGYFVQPTVFSDVTPDMRIAREEIFGPVTAVIPFETEEEVVRAANATEYGLGAAVWTRDFARAHRVARAFRAGTVWINTYLQMDPMSPFGGYKQSGIGRENGRQSLDAYTEIKSVFADLTA